MFKSVILIVIFTICICTNQAVPFGFYKPWAIGLGDSHYGHYVGDLGHGHGYGIGHGIGFGGEGLGGKYIGGEQVGHHVFDGGKKKLNNEYYHKSLGNKGEEFNHGGGGFHKDKIAEKNIKGDLAHFSDAQGGKKSEHEGKDYYGGQHFQKEGRGGEEKTAKKGHRKGHTIKGFKNSYHKDENGQTENFYDEAHDEGGNYAFSGQAAGFGEKGGSAYKGGHTDGKFISGESKKEGHYGQEHVTDEVHGNEGKFGEKKYIGSDVVTGEHKLLDNDDASGHHQSSQIYKHAPTHY